MNQAEHTLMQAMETIAGLHVRLTNLACALDTERTNAAAALAEERNKSEALAKQVEELTKAGTGAAEQKAEEKLQPPG